MTVCYGDPGLLAARLEQAGIPVRREPALTRPIRPIQDARAVGRLRRLFAEANPEVVHVHSSKAGALARLAAPPGLAVVYTVHGLVYRNVAMPRWKRAAYRAIESILLRRSAAVIAVAAADARELQALRGSRPSPPVAVVPNGLGPEWENLPVVPAERPVVGTVARFTEEKALDDLLRAFAAVRASRPEAELWLVGDGPLRPRLQALAQALGMAAAVRFWGFAADVRPLLADMRVFVLSSVKEGAPYSLLEAMAMGRRIVATRVGAVPEMAAGYPAATLVTPRRIDQLAAAVAAALAEDGPPGVAWVPFRVAEMAAATAAVYAQALAARMPGEIGRFSSGQQENGGPGRSPLAGALQQDDKRG